MSCPLKDDLLKWRSLLENQLQSRSGDNKRPDSHCPAVAGVWTGPMLSRELQPTEPSLQAELARASPSMSQKSKWRCHQGHQAVNARCLSPEQHSEKKGMLSPFFSARVAGEEKDDRPKSGETSGSHPIPAVMVSPLREPEVLFLDNQQGAGALEPRCWIQGQPHCLSRCMAG